MVHGPQGPHLLDPGSLWCSSPGLTVPTEQVWVSEQQRTHPNEVEGMHDGMDSRGRGVVLTMGYGYVQ